MSWLCGLDVSARFRLRVYSSDGISRDAPGSGIFNTAIELIRQELYRTNSPGSTNQEKIQRISR